MEYLESKLRKVRKALDTAHSLPLGTPEVQKEILAVLEDITTCLNYLHGYAEGTAINVGELYKRIPSK